MLDCGRDIELNSKEIQWFIDLLQIQEKKRSEDLVAELAQLFQRFHFFKEFIDNKDIYEESPQVILKCAKNAFYTKFQENICIQTSGTTLKRMYFLIRGKIGVYVNLKEECKSQEEIKEKELQQEQLDTNLVNSKDDELINIQEGELVEEKYIKNLTLIETYQPGYHFGNLDLLYQKKSNLYLIAAENCEFACLDKKQYNQFIKKFDESRTHLLMQEISHSFPHWSKNRIKNYFLNFLVLKFKKGETIYSEKEAPLGCYLVKEGNFTSYQFMRLNDVDKQNEETTHFKYKKNLSQGQVDNFDETQSFEKTITNKQNQLHTSPKKQIQLFCLVKGQMFGEEEILQFKNRNFSVKCDSIDGILYFIRKKDFLQIIYDDPEQKYEFQSLAFNKKQLLKMRKKQIKENISQYKSYLWEDRMKIEQENKSLIYLDANKKPKSKLDLNEYLNNSKQKDPTIRNQNSPIRIYSPNVAHNKRSLSLGSLLSQNLINQKSMAFQTPSKFSEEITDTQMQHSQRQIHSNNILNSVESEKLMIQIEKIPTRIQSLQTLNSPRSVDQFQQSSFAQVKTPKKKGQELKLNFNLPILNLEKLSQEKLLEYSPRRYLNKNLRNSNRQKKSQSEHITDQNDQYVSLDSSNNFCTHRSEIKHKIIKIQSTGIDQETLKKSKNISQQVDSLILSQRYKNYQQTLDFFKNYKPINARNLYKDVVNGDSFNNLLQIKLAEKNKLQEKKEKTFNVIQLQQGLKNIQNLTKTNGLQNMFSQNQIQSSNQLIQIQSLIKLDEEQPEMVSSNNSSIQSKIILPIQSLGISNSKIFDLKEQISSNRQKSNQFSQVDSNQFALKKQIKQNKINQQSNMINNVNNFTRLDNAAIQQRDSIQLRKSSLNKLNKILQIQN
ncbi:cyclic nucleotide-binding domain protein (macronuclear) [Tetrahymena thermophila SB210]|uniref:Cyclic nucleotide-binding domain protein n=1 Tax=Tetrahymena thermophila (strain SB210) TaxID=312017 RepID=Q23TZ7_TETTS|nr:cyclic nucleotide-binding domain protein [Tetrahymena thermophila SB210]EAR99984.2 cyclic nucleotide-binding domain protein [Tetrahymena thermophila SB210]|eukprot:XP_001020229.2 cyclic nucleotide-binding domain protein [Tetrahymena thermophila SB210]